MGKSRTIEQFKKSFLEWKSDQRCVICGESRYWLLVCHHRHPQNKKFEVSTTNIRVGNWNKFIRERNKCVVICRNCHDDYHFWKRLKKKNPKIIKLIRFYEMIIEGRKEIKYSLERIFLMEKDIVKDYFRE